jgi:hypothetical protein
MGAKSLIQGFDDFTIDNPILLSEQKDLISSENFLYRVVVSDEIKIVAINFP